MSEDREYEGFAERRQKRMRMTAWIVIIALLLGGGGATVLALILG